MERIEKHYKEAGVEIIGSEMYAQGIRVPPGRQALPMLS